MNQPRTCTPQQLRDANLIRDLDLFLIESLIRTAAAHPGFIEPDPIVQCILTLASRVTGDGHVCLDLGQDAWAVTRQRSRRTRRRFRRTGR